MVHLRPVTREIIFDLLMFEGNGDPVAACEAGEPYGEGAGRVNWYPLDNRASVHRLFHKGKELDYQKIIEILEKIYSKTGATLVEWDRGSGKHVAKARISPGTWLNYKPPKASAA